MQTGLKPPPKFLESGAGYLLVRRSDHNAPEQTVIFHLAVAGDARGEVQRVGVATVGGTSAHRQAPQAGNRQRVAGRILQRAQPIAGERVVGVDGAVAEVADEQGAGVVAEEGRGHRHAPRRVQRATRYQAAAEIAVKIEHIDIAVASASHIVALSVVLFGVGDVERPAEALDVKGRETGGDVGILEAIGDGQGSVVGVEGVDGASGEVSRPTPCWLI